MSTKFPILDNFVLLLDWKVYDQKIVFKATWSYWLFFAMQGFQDKRQGFEASILLRQKVLNFCISCKYLLDSSKYSNYVPILKSSVGKTLSLESRYILTINLSYFSLLGKLNIVTQMTAWWDFDEKKIFFSRMTKFAIAHCGLKTSLGLCKGAPVLQFAEAYLILSSH